MPEGKEPKLVRAPVRQLRQPMTALTRSTMTRLILSKVDDAWWLSPRIVHPLPSQHFRVNCPKQESNTRIWNVRIRAKARAGLDVSLPRHAGFGQTDYCAV